MSELIHEPGNNNDSTPPIVVPLIEDEPVVLSDSGPLVDYTPKKKKKKSYAFKIGLLVYFVILLGLVALALVMLNRFLTDYEAGTPNAALDQYKQWVIDGNYEAIYDASGFQETALNTKDEYLTYLQNLYKNNNTDLSVRERASAQENIKEYSLYSKDKRLSVIYLSQSENKDGKTVWKAATKPEYLSTYYLICSDELSVTVNGTDISLLGLPTEEIGKTLFADLDGTDIMPSIHRYTLENPLLEPKIEALTLGGEACTVSVEETTIRVTAPVAEPESEELKTIATTAAQTYAAFVARDASRTQLLNLIYQDSALYASIKNFSNSFFTSHDSYQFDNLKIDNMARYTDNDFSCDVEFDPTYRWKGKTVEGGHIHYRLTFVKVEDNWKLLTLTTVADSQQPAE